MRRDQLEHIIRAAAAVTGENEFIVVGSQAILGQYPDAPAPLLISMEADLYPPAQPQMSDFIDGSLGPDTLFDKTHGIHADGVSPSTATLPAGWADRLIPICNANTNGATGWRIEVHDIAIAKYAAGREKDLRYTADLWEAPCSTPRRSQSGCATPSSNRPTSHATGSRPPSVATDTCTTPGVGPASPPPKHRRVPPPK